MSGIAGVWHRDGRPVSPGLVSDLGAALAHRGPDGEGTWRRGAFGLVARLHRVIPEAAGERQPAVGRSGAVLVFDGRLDDRADLLDALGDRAPDPRAPDPDLVLAAYERFGEAFVERLAGDFALALFDPDRGRLVLARDAIGVRPLYYHHTSRLVAFASEIKALLAHPDIPARPDEEHLARFLLDDIRGREGSTFFAGIESLPPATVLTITAAGATRRRYWDFDPAARVPCRSLADCAAAFRHHLERAVRRRLRSAHPVAVSVSGGLDSSAIFCLAQAAAAGSPPVIGLSYTPPPGSPADERAFLDAIERRHEVRIERLPALPAALLDGSRQAWHVEAPFVDEQWPTTAALYRAARRRGCRVILTGHWADRILFDQAYLVDLLRRGAWRQVRAHLAEYPRWFTDTDPRLYARRLALDVAKHALPGGLVRGLRWLRRWPARPWFGPRLAGRPRPWPPAEAGWGGGVASVHARALYDEARSAYHVLCMEWNNKAAAAHGMEEAFPFLDRDLLAFLIALPGEAATWHGVPKALLREGLRDLLPAPIAGRRWKADFTDLVNQDLARDFAAAARIILGGAAVRLGYLDRAGLERGLARLARGLAGPDAEAAWSLADLLGLELWLQAFFWTTRGGDDEVVAATATQEALPVAAPDGAR